MKGIEILGTGHADIPRVVTNDELSTFVDTNDEWITTRTGIKQRHFVADDVKNLDIAIEAARNALQDSKINPEDIGCVIVATFTPDDFIPSIAAGVHSALGLPTECVAFDISVACAGFVYAMDTARCILLSRPGKYAIAIGSEVISKILNFSDRNTSILFGDGAGAVVMGLSDKKYIFRCGVDYQRDKLYAPFRGSNGERCGLIMEGQEVFKFAVGVMEEGIQLLLNDANCTVDEIDSIICHQANERIISRVRKRLGIAEEKIYTNLQNYGNTSAASVPIALSEMYKKGLLHEGMKIIIIGFGAGLIWGGMYMEL